jgi:septal ring factor EnvC (AmiA/AmiB activator)
MARSGEAGVDLANQQEDLSDTNKAYAEDKKFLIDVTQDCKTKEGEKAANDKMRADELLALADTIKILNDDDALDLFKKTLPSPSLLQMQVTSTSMKQRALKLLAKGRKHHKDFRLNLISMALRGKKVSFDKVVGMIDEMSKLLKEEQAGDERKKAYCEKNLDETEDTLKQLQLDTKDLEKAIEDHKESIAALGKEITALTDGIKNLDKQVASATAQRKEEHAEYEETMASDGAAKELLGLAKNRLAKFYSPKQYKAAPKREMTEEERISVNMGGTLAPTAAPGGIAGTGVTAAFAQYQEEAQEQNLGFLQVRASKKAAPPPPPATASAYKKSGEESNGVMAMLDLLVKDLDKEMQTMKVEETEAQKEYEQLIKDSAEKRSTDSKSISDKEGNKVELEANTLKMQQERKDKMRESMAKMESLQSLHSECDWLIKNFATRKEARASELENLTNAKAVLSGADYSFLQTALVHRHV